MNTVKEFITGPITRVEMYACLRSIKGSIMCQKKKELYDITWAHLKLIYKQGLLKSASKGHPKWQ